MSEVMKSRFHEVVPESQLLTMSAPDVEKAVKIAFEVVGYTPKDSFKKIVDRAWGESTATELWEFVYDVWRLDNGS